MIPLTQWAEDHDIPKRTADQWAKDDKIPTKVGFYTKEIVRKTRIKGRMIDPNIDPKKLGLL